MSEGVRKAGDLVGDYRLEKVVSEGLRTRTWKADQISMQRPVMLEMLKNDAALDPHWVEAFLADVRAKALVKHSGIGTVYEAVSNEEATFFARERLEGDNLEVWYEEGKLLSPIDVVKLLNQVAAAMLYLENEGIATVEFSLNHFILESGNRIRLMNLAVDGAREEIVNLRSKQLLGAIFDEMVKAGEPGETRVRSLLGFMADLDRAVPLTWLQILTLSNQVREQLEGNELKKEPPPAVVVPLPKEPIRIPPAVLALFLGLALIGGLVFFFLNGEKNRPSAEGDFDSEKPARIEIPAGEYANPGGGLIRLAKNLQFGRTEVTLAQYRDFLESGDLEKFRHPDQPTSKKNHQPDDWKGLWSAAVNGGLWMGRPVSKDCPVVGVDWWDAFAYSQWEGSRLPTMKEWTVAASHGGAPAKASGWGPVGNPNDLTGSGLSGMAGGVQEWTLDVEVNPAFQLSPKKPVSAGGSFAEPAQGISTRVWFDDRDVRRDNLGFRTVIEK